MFPPFANRTKASRLASLLHFNVVLRAPGHHPAVTRGPVPTLGVHNWQSRPSRNIFADLRATAPTAVPFRSSVCFQGLQLGPSPSKSFSNLYGGTRWWSPSLTRGYKKSLTNHPPPRSAVDGNRGLAHFVTPTAAQDKRQPASWTGIRTRRGNERPRSCRRAHYPTATHQIRISK